MARLSFAPLYRAATTASDGSLQTERHSLDFVVDGVSLFARLGGLEYDLIGLLGWAPMDSDRASVQRLLLEAPAPLPGGRQCLFVCAECGEIGCGAITAAIVRHDDLYTWCDFAYESVDEPALDLRRALTSVGPFTFLATEYRGALLSRLPVRG